MKLPNFLETSKGYLSSKITAFKKFFSRIFNFPTPSLFKKDRSSDYEILTDEDTEKKGVEKDGPVISRRSSVASEAETEVLEEEEKPTLIRYLENLSDKTKVNLISPIANLTFEVSKKNKSISGRLFLKTFEIKFSNFESEIDRNKDKLLESLNKDENNDVIVKINGKDINLSKSNIEVAGEKISFVEVLKSKTSFLPPKQTENSKIQKNTLQTNNGNLGATRGSQATKPKPGPDKPENLLSNSESSTTDELEQFIQKATETLGQAKNRAIEVIEFSTTQVNRTFKEIEGLINSPERKRGSIRAKSVENLVSGMIQFFNGQESDRPKSPNKIGNQRG